MEIYVCSHSCTCTLCNLFFCKNTPGLQSWFEGLGVAVIVLLMTARPQLHLLSQVGHLMRRRQKNIHPTSEDKELPRFERLDAFFLFPFRKWSSFNYALKPGLCLFHWGLGVVCWVFSVNRHDQLFENVHVINGHIKKLYVLQLSQIVLSMFCTKNIC